MKANEAPEKIYISHHTVTDSMGEPVEEFWEEWSEEKELETDIEYTRTDAFVEKACEWLSKHAIKYYFGSSKFLGTDELVEDFKIAMRL